MAGTVDTALAPLRDNIGLTYIGYGMLGGYVGTALSTYSEGATIPFSGRYMIESAFVGGATNWLGLVAFGVDPFSMWKGALLGAAGSWAWHRFVRNIFQNWNIVA